MKKPEPTIRINVDPTNPGQFFACCGLLELADRLWNGAEGWFDEAGYEFFLSPLIANNDTNASVFLATLSDCNLVNTMTSSQLDHLAELKSIKTKDQSTSEKLEKKSLEKLWREKPIKLQKPFSIHLDWFLDSRAGGSRFKTWAGQQSVIDIAKTMKQLIDEGKYTDVSSGDWLSFTIGHYVSFKFDSQEGGHSSAIDVCFVLDLLKMSSGNRPFLELLAFIGLERFRPKQDGKLNSYVYSTWTTPLLPAVAYVVATGEIQTPDSRSFEFPILYRTKYLKSFLPAQPTGDKQ